MRKRVLILIIIILMILVIPIRREANDGGTVEYSAILYKVIKWNRIREYEENKTGTEVHFFPNSLHSLEWYDDIRPNAIAFIDNENNLVVANMGTYSWTKKVDGILLNTIGDTFGMEMKEFKKTLKVVYGGSFKSDKIISNVTDISVYKYEEDEIQRLNVSLEYDKENGEIDVSNLEKGTYILQFFIKDESNKVSHSIKVQIVSEDEINIQNEDLYGQTFYAEIKKINDFNILVDGLDVNDINYRGEFSFKILEKTKLEWRNTPINISDLDEGDKISITFKGEIQETYPAGIKNVTRIQLLEDEK